MNGLSPVSRKAVIATMVISLTFLLYTMTAPLLSYIIASYEGVNAMLLLQIPAFVGLLVSLAVGPLALKLNLKYLITISALAILAYYMIFAFVGSGGPFILLLVAAGTVGITHGSAVVLTSSIIGAYVQNPAQRANFVAISGAIMSVGSATVNIVGGIIAAGNGGLNWPNAYWLGLVVVPALIIFWILMPKAPESTEAATTEKEGTVASAPVDKGKIPAKAFMIVATATFAFVGISVFLLNVGTYIVGELQIGTSAESGLANSLFTIAGIFAGFAFPVLFKVMKSWIVPIGYALSGAGMLCLILLNSSLIGLFVGAALCGLGFTIAFPYITGRLMEITPQHWIPVVMSLSVGGMKLATTLTPYIMGALGGLIDSTIRSQMIIAAIFLFIAVILSAILFVFMKDPEKPKPVEQN